MTQFAETLKLWRKARRYSQLDLAIEADVSSRHLSFLETGRANPSREMIGRLGDALSLPLAARNQMLAQAGFAARYPQRNWEAEEMAPVRAAVTHLLNQHQPYPAIAIDRHWTILQMNNAATQLFALLGAGVGSSMIDTLLDPNVQTNIENWPQVAHHSLHRLRTESASRGGDPALQDAIEALAQVPAPKEPSLMPVVPTVFRQGDLRLSLFTTIAQFGTPEDLALDDLKIELFFPSDDATDAVLQAMGQ